MSSIMEAVAQDNWENGSNNQHTEDVAIVNLIKQRKTNELIKQQVECTDEQINAFRNILA